MKSTNCAKNFPSYQSIHGMVLMGKVTEQVEALGVDVEQTAEVTDLRLTGTVKVIETENFLYKALSAIPSIERKPVTLDIDNSNFQKIHLYF